MLNKTWFDVEEAAYLISVHADELRVAIDAGNDGMEFPKAYRRAGQYEYHVDDLKQWRDKF